MVGRTCYKFVHSKNNVYRRAYLMTHICKENALCLVAAACLFHCLVIHFYLKKHSSTQGGRCNANAGHNVTDNSFFIGKRRYKLRETISCTTAGYINDYLGCGTDNTCFSLKHKKSKHHCKHKKTRHTAVISACCEEHYRKQQHKN